MAEKYTAALKSFVVTPTVPDGFVSSWAQYTVLLSDRTQRNRVQTALKEKGIPTMVYYPRGLHQQKAYANMELCDADYPNTIEATERVLALPMHPYVADEDQQFIIKSILEVL